MPRLLSLIFMEDKKIRQAFNRIGFGLATLVLGYTALLFGALFLLASFLPDIVPRLMDSGWAYTVFSYVTLYWIALPLALLVLRTTPSYPPAAPILSITPGQMAKTVCACASITMLLNIVGMALGRGISQMKGEEISNPLQTMMLGASPLPMFFLVVVVAPVMEELLFRWVLYKKLAVFGPKIYFLVSALAFSLFHMNLFQLLYAFVLGLIFAAMTYYTGTVKYSIIAHAGVNLMGGGMSVLVMAYGNEQMLTVWGFCILLVVGFGLVFAIQWLRMTGGRIYLPAGAVALPAKRAVVCNPGMLCYLAVTVGLTIYALLA